MAGEPVGRMPQRPLNKRYDCPPLFGVWRQDHTVNPQTVIKRPQA